MKLDGGLNVSNSTKKIDKDSPIITIVTVVYNGEQEIEETIRSIVGQSYKNIEFIVIDGASKDNTLEIVKKYEDKIDYWLSEKDNGIYDAMNKAIALAKGEWINFMNAGDTFASEDVIEKIFSTNNLIDYDFVYGQHIWKSTDEYVLVPTRPLELMWQRISFCHQSLFSRTNMMKEKPFDLSYKIVCDYENYFSGFMNGRRFFEIKFPISVFSAGGFSDINFLKRTQERYKVVKNYKNDWELKTYYLKTIVLYYMSQLKKRILNEK